MIRTPKLVQHPTTHRFSGDKKAGGFNIGLALLFAGEG
jgi:hypothetical protein